MRTNHACNSWHGRPAHVWLPQARYPIPLTCQREQGFRECVLRAKGPAICLAQVEGLGK